jgi:hypothetical protein
MLLIDTAIDLPQLRTRLTNLQAVRSVLQEFDQQDQRNRVARSMVSINADFAVGDTVLLFNNSRRGKMTPKWKGVYVIHKMIGSRAAVIRHVTSNDTQVVAVQRLKKYYQRNRAQPPVAALPAAIPIVVPPALAPAPPVAAPAAVAPAPIEARTLK